MQNEENEEKKGKESVKNIYSGALEDRMGGWKDDAMKG